MDGSHHDFDTLDDLPGALALTESAFPELTTGAAISKAQIARYYDRSFWGYTLLHSREGAVHMALDTDGFHGQAAEIKHLLPDEGPILEVGCGRGFNLALLAEHRPDLGFKGIDYSPSHVRAAKKKLDRFPNAEIARGDFHALDIADDSAAMVYAVETLCHAQDYDTVLAELHRVLRPGGQLVIFDGFRTCAPAAPDIAKAMRYTEAAMAVPAFADTTDFETQARAAGFAITENTDRTADILPMLRTMSRRARRFYARPLLRRLIMTLAPRELAQNSVAALLMATTCQAGAHAYRRVILTKPA
ncbi:MAG: class I SAM-dependent methyltransferase [Pseudomonadota bacterium]